MKHCSGIFGKTAILKRRRKRTQDIENVIRNLAELTLGNAVVHLEHGVGRYRGLQTLDLGGHTTEFLTLEYAGGDKLYVPVSNLHLISHYGGVDVEHSPLHRMGSDKWEREKKKAAARVRDVAAELLDIYARRGARKGFVFNAPNEDYHSFAAGFPFEETIDQEAAITQVISDMCAKQPMDRLICGDVGFGKTEVALRAAFLAVQSGKQVAILVPTTLLAQQHYQSFCDRFANWPIQVDLLSRFRTTKEQNSVIAALKQGKCDILIGTHRLLNSEIEYQELGLLIIDEEHRFGVRQKDRLKALRAEVDILTMTATPIPRTLNMATSGLRDLSIIATPPAKRLAIKTFIHQRDNSIIRDAILREIQRGGQVYFLHNKVMSIQRVAQELQELLPAARIAVAHGQLAKNELENIMSDFYHQRFNVLVCTTIIETGIDVPTANTILIDRADTFGLSQLHQLRGRVGRSHHQAYAYLMVPDQQLITNDAKKRLDAITSMEELGSGFILASHDLEIRGAGELLGEEQSGHIQAIGFTLYTQLLEDAIEALKSGREPSIDFYSKKLTEIDLQMSSLIPEDYLSDVHSRLVLYKRIANAESPGQLEDLQVEMIDRFGLLPPVTSHLFTLAEIKLFAKPLGVRKIDAGPKGIRLEFSEHSPIDPTVIIKLIQSAPQNFRFEGGVKLRYMDDLTDTDKRIAKVQWLLGELK